MHHRDARCESLDRLLDGLVPDGVSGEVEVVEDEAAHRRQRVAHRAEAVPRRRAIDREPVPVDVLVDRPHVEPDRAEPILVLGLAEDGNVAGQQPLGGLVEVILVTVRHEDGVEAGDDLLGREREFDRRVANGVRGLLDRRSGTGRVEHRIDQDPPPISSSRSVALRTRVMLHAGISSGFAIQLRIPRYTPRSDDQRHPRDPNQPEAGVWTTGPDGELIPDYDGTFPTINEGEVVHGTVVRVDKDEVLVDIGYKSEGVIPVSELSIRRNVNPADEVSVGDEIDALVMTKEDAEGRLLLSKKRARFELAWKAIEGAAESGEPVNGKVIEVVKGGLILDLGVRGFLPASLVDIRRVQDLDEFLGKELRCKVIELNRSRNNVVLSRRAVLEDERKEMRQAILDRLNPGDVVEGTISNIVDFGAFVDLDGMDGLIHISELSWSHVNHPSEVLEIGQTVEVKVLDIDRERQRISLGLKQTQSDPWQQVLDSYREDDVVEGRVTKVVTFGAFVEILPGVEGLVHISELANHHVENPREVVSQGDPVNVLILEIDGERRRLSLSLKRVEEGAVPVPRADGAESVHSTPDLKLSEEAFPTGGAVAVEEDADLEATEAVEQPSAEAEESRLPRRSPTRSSPRRRRRGAEASRSRRPSRDEIVAEVVAGGRCEAERPRGGRGGRSTRPPSRRPTSRIRRARRRGRGRRDRVGAGLPRSSPRHPIAVAITGGIGAGKSTALEAFRAHGAATVSSDEIVHHLLATDDDVRDAIVASAR